MIEIKIYSSEKVVKEFFSSKQVLSYYSDLRLHLTEKRLFQKYLKKKGKVLDLCCGAGRVAIPLAKMSFDVIGIDNNLKMIKEAKKLKRELNIKNVKFIFADVSKIRFKREKFDYILIMENSLEHIVSKEKRGTIIENAYKSLKNGGLLITSFNSCFYPLKIPIRLFINNINYFLNRIFFRNYQLGFNDIILNVNLVKNKKKGQLFFHFFTPFEIKKMLRKAGFVSFEIIPFNKFYKRKNIFKDIKIYEIFWAFLYQFWIVKK